MAATGKPPCGGSRCAGRRLWNRWDESQGFAHEMMGGTSHRQPHRQDVGFTQGRFVGAGISWLSKGPQASELGGGGPSSRSFVREGVKVQSAPTCSLFDFHNTAAHD